MQNLREQFLQETKHKATNVAGKLTDKYAKWLETKMGEQSRQAAVSGSVCEHKEKRRIFENCECVKCGTLLIQ